METHVRGEIKALLEFDGPIFALVTTANMLTSGCIFDSKIHSTVPVGTNKLAHLEHNG